MNDRKIKYVDLNGLKYFAEELKQYLESHVLEFSIFNELKGRIEAVENQDFYKVVDELPEKGVEKLIYLVYNEDNENFLEYIWKGDKFEQLGSFTPQLSLDQYLKIEDAPFEKGNSENSAVLKGEYQGYSNKAISQTSMAVGAGTTAGLKGWYYSKIEFGNTPIITLSDKQPYALLGNLVGGEWKSGTPNISVGDKVSIVNDSKYDYCGEVKSISGNKVTLKSALPFDTLDIGAITVNNPDDWSIYIPERPDAGIIDFGGGAFSEGGQSKATNICSHAEGLMTHAYGQYSHAEGMETKAGYAAHAEGKNTTASGSRSHAEGQNTVASGDMSHAQGIDTIASGARSFATGNGTIAEGAQSIVGGYKSKSAGDSAISIGHRTYAKGQDSICIGISNHEVNTYESKTNEEILAGVKDGSIVASIALGNQSQAIGGNVFAYGSQAHAEGWRTKAIGNHSHAEGNYSIAEGNNSYAGGNYCNANGTASFATGDHTKTTNDNEAAFGKYNVSNDDTVFSIGIGTSDSNRKNAFEVKQNGDTYLCIGGQLYFVTPITDDELNELFND